MGYRSVAHPFLLFTFNKISVKNLFLNPFSIYKHALATYSKKH